MGIIGLLLGNPHTRLFGKGQTAVFGQGADDAEAPFAAIKTTVPVVEENYPGRAVVAAAVRS
jgi:hypothetical protein